MAKKKIAALVLAAGKGTRMKSDIPKVLHELSGKSLIGNIVDVLDETQVQKTVIVVGYQGSTVKRSLKDKKITFVTQAKQLGTGHAVLMAKKALSQFSGDVLILAGDVPLIDSATLKAFFKYHQSKKAKATILTTKLGNPKGYGRIVRNKKGNVERIVEELDASTSEKKIREINSGIYFFNSKLLFKHLSSLKVNSKKKEYYLTDIIESFIKDNLNVQAYPIKDSDKVQGVNSRKDLVALNAIRNQKNIEKLLDSGVTVLSPSNTFIDSGVTVGKDTVIYPFTVIERGVKIGKKCQIGPFCKIRKGSKVDDEAVIGSFVEVNRSQIKKKTSIKHLAYLGDSVVGPSVNIGAGTITANFDGKKKHKTIIQEGAQIGSNTVLVAPANVGKKAKTGAGTVVRPNQKVPAKKTAVGVPARILK